MNTQLNKKNVLTLVGLFALPFVSMAQEAEAAATVSYFSNALFNTLLVTIILLAVLVMALSGVLKNISNSDILLNKLRAKDSESDKSKPTNVVGMILLLVFTSLSSFAQEKAITKIDDGRIGGLDQFTFYFMATTIFLEFIVILVLVVTIRYILKTDAFVSETQAASKPKEKTILDKWSDAVEVENEESILLDHNYDGIKELDNNLPPWWKYGFYLTILVAIIYLVNYHIIKTSPLQAEEYTISMKKAEAEIAEFMKTSANNVDESTVKMLDNPSDLAAGKELFISTCSPCHGKFGEGTVGPNLTDDYWIHLGGVKDIFKTIKYGWPEKGMKSWKEDFSPMQMAQLTSFIRTLRGTNPPKQKDKQGDLYVENAQPTDSTAISNDSLKVVAVADSLKK